MPTPACRVPPVTPAHASWGALPVHAKPEDDLPLDPRSWSRAAVARWVLRRGGAPARFPMNGKALCLMTREMFGARVPRHGDALYQDFRRRLARALALQELMDKLQMAANK